MEQPNLGKKIADLRKAKGFTQEELVQKCQLNVRTLQRIENGEVMPRAYTIRAIFNALDYDYSKDLVDLEKSETKQNPEWLTKGLDYLRDLFNLKTNTMKKISILSAPVVIACLTMLLVNVFTTQAIEKKDLTGTWVLSDSFGNPAISEYKGKKTVRYKVMAESSMVWIEVDQSTNVAHILYFGSYNVVDNTFIESIDYTATGLESDRGIVNHFNTKIENGFWYVKGTDNSYDEIWKKVEPIKILK